MSILRSIVASLAVLSVVSVAAAGAGDADWEVHGRINGKEKGKKSTDVSGIACTTSTGFPRSCLVIDDNMQAAQFVTVRKGELQAAEELVPLMQDEFDGKPLELDGEGVAYAAGYFYVVGSHGHPRDKDKKLHPVDDADEIKAKIAAASQVIRLRLKPGVTNPVGPGDVGEPQRSSKLRAIIASEPALKRFLDRRLENNGLTIEGVAVIGDRLFAGFRGPTLENGRAPVLAVSLQALFANGALQSKLHALPVGDGRGIRDLAPFDNGLLVLAGPTGDGPGRYDIYWWDTASDNVSHLADITQMTDATAKRKPEALLPLDQGPSGIRVLVFFDGEKNGAPREIVVPAP